LLTIGFDPEFGDQMDLVNNQRTLTILKTKLKELGHEQAQIKMLQSPAPVGWSMPESDATNSRTSPPVPPATDNEPAPSDTPHSPPRSEAPANASPPENESDEQFKKDPLIQKALEIFKRRIVEIRA
jgi:hypothetical protein